MCICVLTRYSLSICAMVLRNFRKFLAKCKIQKQKNISPNCVHNIVPKNAPHFFWAPNDSYHTRLPYCTVTEAFLFHSRFWGYLKILGCHLKIHTNQDIFALICKKNWPLCPNIISQICSNLSKIFFRNGIFFFFFILFISYFT